MNANRCVLMMTPCVLIAALSCADEVDERSTHAAPQVGKKSAGSAVDAEVTLADFPDALTVHLNATVDVTDPTKTYTSQVSELIAIDQVSTHVNAVGVEVVGRGELLRVAHRARVEALERAALHCDAPQPKSGSVMLYTVGQPFIANAQMQVTVEALVACHVPGSMSPAPCYQQDYSWGIEKYTNALLPPPTGLLLDLYHALNAPQCHKGVLSTCPDPSHSPNASAPQTMVLQEELLIRYWQSPYAPPGVSQTYTVADQATLVNAVVAQSVLFAPMCPCQTERAKVGRFHVSADQGTSALFFWHTLTFRANYYCCGGCN